MQTETVMMPRELTAENGAKALLSGEFRIPVVVDTCDQCGGDGWECEESEEECHECHGTGEVTMNIDVPWDTIKEIYRKAVEHLAT